MPTPQMALVTVTSGIRARVREARSAQSTPVFRAPVPSQQGPGDSLVSVGSFPQLVGSDPPGEVKKPHGVLKVEVRDCGVLAKRKQRFGIRARPGWGAPRLLTRRPLLLKPRELKPHEGKGLVHRSEAGTEGSGPEAWVLAVALTLPGPGTLSRSRTH